MIRLLILFLWTVSSFAQTTETYYPQEDKNAKGDEWFQVNATSGSQTFNFYFNFGSAKKGRSGYTGSNTLFVWFDSTATSSPTTGNVTVTAIPLVYDVIDKRYEPIADTGEQVAVKASYNWVAVHNDASVSIMNALNLALCDGVRVTISNAEAQDILTRAVLKQARGKR